MTIDTMTIIRCYAPLLLAKRITGDQIQACDRVKKVDLHERAIGSLADLEERLIELTARPDCAAVRGGVLDAARTQGVQRLLYDDPKTGAKASLKAQPRRWLGLDFDGLAAPSWLDRTDLMACGKHVRSLLPPAFHMASCVAQATASHLITPGIHLRLWVWLSRAVSEQELKIWLKNAPIDLSLFSAAQIHYTARPIFMAGKDPIPERLAVLFGVVDAVTVPDAAILTPPVHRTRPMPQAGSIRASGHASLILTQIAAAVLRAEEGQRHKTIVLGAHRLAELERAGLLHPDESTALLHKAARGAGFDDARLADVDRILTWARRSCAGEQYEAGLETGEGEA